MVNNQVIIKKLEDFGLSKRQAEIYLSLLESGIQSPLELSKRTNINRTTLYRELEIIQKMGLVEEIVEEASTKFSATSPQTLELLIAKKEAEISRLKLNVNDIINSVSSVPSNPPNTSVKFYRGIDGLRQLLWNTLKAKSKVVGYGYSDWNEGVGRSFAEKLRQEYAERQILNLEILNSNPSNPSFTSNTSYLKTFYQCRFLPKSTIEINHDTYIYNDIYAIYHYINNEPFGIEIQNAEIAKTQTQIFEFLWKSAKKPTR